MRAAAGCLLVLLTALPSLAADEAVVSPEDFRDLVKGRTVHYTLDGEYYGSEQFYGDDQATWQNPGGSCEHGHWWEAQAELCFRYGNVSCWKVYESGGDRHAVSRSGLRVEIEGIDDRPLLCEGVPVS